jgi:hypothetical protein
MISRRSSSLIQETAIKIHKKVIRKHHLRDIVLEKIMSVVKLA